jgi:hypothetical protein
MLFATGPMGFIDLSWGISVKDVRVHKTASFRCFRHGHDA